VSNKKKVNQLTFSECRGILEKLDNQQNSKYYRDVLHRFETLLPKTKPHIPKKND
jgi:hypothetical protein